MNVYIISSLARNTPMSATFLGTMPFFSTELVRVLLLLAAPCLVFWLPRLLAG